MKYECAVLFGGWFFGSACHWQPVESTSSMESFFCRSRPERTARKKIIEPGRKAKADVFDYIERFYNANAGTRQSAK
jgi:hypothetical protein